MIIELLVLIGVISCVTVIIVLSHKLTDSIIRRKHLERKLKRLDEYNEHYETCFEDIIEHIRNVIDIHEEEAMPKNHDTIY